jgi:hypothetical protein
MYHVRVPRVSVAHRWTIVFCWCFGFIIQDITIYNSTFNILTRFSLTIRAFYYVELECGLCTWPALLFADDCHTNYFSFVSACSLLCIAPSKPTFVLKGKECTRIASLWGRIIYVTGPYLDDTLNACFAFAMIINKWRRSFSAVSCYRACYYVVDIGYFHVVYYEFLFYTRIA